MDSNDPQVIDYAFKQRLLREIPDPDDDFIDNFKCVVNEYVQANYPQVQPLEFEDWLSSTSYTDEQKDKFRVVYKELNGGPPTKKQCAHIDTFVKTECYPSYKHARMINSRCDAFKVFSGPRFKAIEQVVYLDPHFIKHISVPDRPALIAALINAGCRYYNTDFTAFESHFTPELMDACECVLYRWCLRNDRYVEVLCSAITGRNSMRTRSGCYADVMGRRMSGDMCTSLGNGFTNLMLIHYLSVKHNFIYDGYVEGDDGIFAICNFELTKDHYLACGFSIKIVELPSPCLASFCGLVCGRDLQIIRDPYRFIQKFGWTHSLIYAGDRIMNELLRAKALSAVYESPHCPIVGVLARYALSVTRGCNPRFVDDGYHTLPPDEFSIPEFSPSLETRQLFQDCFSISVSEQYIMESLINQGKFDLLSPLLLRCLSNDDFINKTTRAVDMLDYESKYVVAT